MWDNAKKQWDEEDGEIYVSGRGGGNNGRPSSKEEIIARWEHHSYESSNSPNERILRESAFKPVAEIISAEVDRCLATVYKTLRPRL